MQPITTGRKNGLCPLCGEQILEKDNARFNMDGENHACLAKLKPIGLAIIGQKIVSFSVRDHRVTLQIGSNMVLEIFGKNSPVIIRLVTPNGIIEE